MNIKERLLSKVDWSACAAGHTCWEFLGHRDRDGYGRFGIGKTKMVGAHRLSYELHTGPIPEDMLVCHSCDNPGCINPNHLWLGTCKNNIGDCWNKGRQGDSLKQGNSLPGEKNPNHKLTKEQVKEIRSIYKKGVYGFGCNALGRKYGVNHQTIYSIVTNKTWL